MTITIAVAGSGPVDKGTVYELLDDWLGIDANGKPTTDETVELILPAAADHTTPAVKALYAWSGQVDPELPYTAVVAPTLNKAARIIRDNAESSIAAKDDEVYTATGRHLANGDGERYLLVAGDKDDEDLAELVDYAHGEDITVLDLRDALKQIEPPAPEPESAELESEDETGTQEDEPEEEPVKGGTQTLVPLPEQPEADDTEDEEAGAEEGQGDSVVVFERPQSVEEAEQDLEQVVADAHRKLTAADPEGIQGVVAVLEDVANHLRLVDEANAAANLAPVRYRPITQRVESGLTWAKRLTTTQAAVHPARWTEPAEPVEKPAKKAAATGKPRREWLNPDTGNWEPLRGRPRKDVEIREVAA
ncbi:hypothetical protein [Streptomyces sp. NPDC004528]|uniref:hypothetical protein n=1 Tax=Streptomyces sp. NPDC004528 TaxID=3154550 RepID=UPI0033BD89E9